MQYERQTNTRDQSRVIGGLKSAINNPRTSNEAREQARRELWQNYGINYYSGAVAQEHRKDPSNVAAGLKSALHNPNVSPEAKEHARERLRNGEY